jgi:HPt (histidine-containing phosphotransfer) domain-containing protein
MNHIDHGLTATNGDLSRHLAPTRLTSPSVDLSALEMLDGMQEPGQPDLVAELIGLFLEDSEKQMKLIDAGLAAQNALQVQQAAHSLKGSSGSMGARLVADVCVELEMINAHAHWPGVPILVEKLRSACIEACEILTAERQRRT